MSAGLMQKREVRVSDFVRFGRDVSTIMLLKETCKMVKMAEICQGMKTEFEKEPKECGGVYLLGRVVQSIGEATMFNGLTSAKLIE